MFKKLKKSKETKKAKKPRIKKFKLPKLKKTKKAKKPSNKESKVKTKIGKKRRAMSLRHKLIGSLVIFAALPVIIVSVLSSSANTKAVENSVGSYSQSMVDQFGHAFDGIIGQTRNTLMQYMLMSDVQSSSLAPDSDDRYEDAKRDMRIDDALHQLFSSNTTLDGFIVANNLDRIYYRDKNSAMKDQVQKLKDTDFFNSDLVDRIRQNPGPLWLSSLGEGMDGIYLGWHYTGRYTGAEGVVIASLDIAEIQELVDVFDIEGVSELYIVDEDRNIILSPGGEGIGSPLELSYIDKVCEEDSGTFIEAGNLVSTFTFVNGWSTVYQAPIAVLMEDVIKAQNNTLVVAIICILLAILIGFIIATSISRPINRLSQAMAEAETGNLAVEYTYNSDNEIGRLVSSFNHMLENIKALILDTQTVAETIESNTETLQTVAQSTATASNQTTHAIESIAKGTEGQTVQIIHSTEMMDNLSVDINLATDKVAAVQTVANNTMKVSNETVSTMEELTTQSEKTIEISAEIEKQIEELGEEASQITHVIAMIQSISEQTNLLALNATIEAARAGEAGRGFGVVADEIRKLANESKEATSRIEEIIINIMTKKDASIQGARDATNLIALQRPIVDNTNDAFDQINAEMERVVTQLDELRDLFGNITRDKDDTVVAISEISDIIEQSASAAEEVFATSAEQSASAESIADMSNILLQGVEELKAAQQKFRL